MEAYQAGVLDSESEEERAVALRGDPHVLYAPPSFTHRHPAVTVSARRGRKEGGGEERDR